MDSAAASAGPWLLLGIVLGLLVAGAAGLAVGRIRSRRRPAADGTQDPQPAPGPDTGWAEDDLPGFLDQPPGARPDPVPVPAPAHGPGPQPGLAASAAPFAEAGGPVRRAVPAHAAAGAPEPSRPLLVLTGAALVLVGAASALAALTAGDPSSAASAAPSGTAPPSSAPPRPGGGPPPTWDVPDLVVPPERPRPGDPGAGRLAAVSVPIGPDGALARLSFDGLVLERRAVGVTAAYPSVSVTAAEVPGGPALAHVRLPAWNCLTDVAPDDPVAAGCRRLPTEYADLPSPALSVTSDGDRLRITGRFRTYVRPGGSAPDWTGRVYPLTVHVAPDGDSATGSLHLGTERARALADPRLSELRLGG